MDMAGVKKYAKTLTPAEEQRASIRVGVLLNLLHGHALGQIELSAARQRSIEILLRKAMPDLASVEHKGDPDVPVIQRIERVILQHVEPTSASPDVEEDMAIH